MALPPSSNINDSLIMASYKGNISVRHGKHLKNIFSGYKARL